MCLRDYVSRFNFSEFDRALGLGKRQRRSAPCARFGVRFAKLKGKLTASGGLSLARVSNQRDERAETMSEQCQRAARERKSG